MVWIVSGPFIHLQKCVYTYVYTFTYILMYTDTHNLFHKWDSIVDTTLKLFSLIKNLRKIPVSTYSLPCYFKRLHSFFKKSNTSIEYRCKNYVNIKGPKVERQGPSNFFPDLPFLLQKQLLLNSKMSLWKFSCILASMFIFFVCF